MNIYVNNEEAAWPYEEFNVTSFSSSHQMLYWGSSKSFDIFNDELIWRNLIGIILQVSELIAR